MLQRGVVLPDFLPPERLHEKGGERHEVPCHSELALDLTAWTEAACISGDKKTPLFRSDGQGRPAG